MIRSIIGLRGGGGFTTRGDRLIISGGLTTSGELNWGWWVLVD